MAGEGTRFEFKTRDDSSAECAVLMEFPREGPRAVLLAPIDERPGARVAEDMASVAWQVRRKYFGGGEPEVWIEQSISQDGEAIYAFLTFTSPWQSGTYGQAIRRPALQEEVVQHFHGLQALNYGLERVRNWPEC